METQVRCVFSQNADAAGDGFACKPTVADYNLEITSLRSVGCLSMSVSEVPALSHKSPHLPQQSHMLLQQ